MRKLHGYLKKFRRYQQRRKPKYLNHILEEIQNFVSHVLKLLASPKNTIP
jgi:hypothetical protein